ncbi:MULTISPECIES: hypothetical protein [unclassified Pseudoalteromonas]|uniref:hypothetical protein n=1 Tax=unclassified Pseudoalteromonas TaxID=194690 RepID=UPI002098103B|nr:hypothetical protein [Pseudoalteromonas sp. XMcav2-N]MCO7190363.1 hypothetical protein [Pseudoalteromonas sp. XMcav2-N]
MILRKDIDYSTYSLSELKEAWLSVDEDAYPERAIELYTHIKSLEPEDDKETAEGEVEEATHWLEDLLCFLFKPRSNFVDTTFSDELLEQSNAEMKEQRVLAMIEAKRKAEESDTQL